MNRRCRIALEVLGPPPLGLLMLAVPWLGDRWVAGEARVVFNPETFTAVVFAVVAAYLIAGIPSLLYAFVMERGFRSGMASDSWRMVANSTWLGGAAGLAMAMFVFEAFAHPPMFAWFGGSGLGAGFALGLAIKVWSSSEERPPVANHRRHSRTAALVIALPVLAWAITRNKPAWITMWAVAFAEFFALKLFTLREAGGDLGRRRALACFALWPGLNAHDFLGDRPARPEWTRPGVALGALANLALGAGLLGWALRHFASSPPLLVGWVGMAGLIFLLHFGAFRLVAWAWCRAGVDAPPIMRNPLAATSLAEFWSERWNVAFADTARRFVFRPLARRVGAKSAGAAVFLLSGLIHESVLSLPAGGGWGGPTLYFALQAAGIAAEKSPVGRSLGLGAGWRGWLWTLAVTAAPVPLLFHAPFVGRVIVPFLHEISRFLP